MILPFILIPCSDLIIVLPFAFVIVPSTVTPADPALSIWVLPFPKFCKVAPSATVTPSLPVPCATIFIVPSTSLNEVPELVPFFTS